MGYMQMFDSIENGCEGQDQKGYKVNAQKRVWTEKSFWKGCVLGLCVGTVFALVISMIIGFTYIQRHTDKKTYRGSSGLQSLQCNITSTNDSGDPLITSPQTSTYKPEIISTVIHTCQVMGGYNKPPKIKEGNECIFESKDGRTSVRYTVLSRTSTTIYDHCPVSFCSGNNVWSEFNVSSSGNGSEGQDQKGDKVNAQKRVWTEKSFWKGCVLGLCVGTVFASVISMIVGFTYMQRQTDRKTYRGSSGLQSLQGNITSTNDSGDPLITSLQTSTYKPEIITTVIHTCQVMGGCNKPPKIKEGNECIFESKDGRTSVRYTVLSRTSTTTYDHCPVSFCSGNNVWSEFNVSSSTKECYSNSNRGAVYGGKNTCTITGRTCQRWDSDYPHKRNRKHIPTNTADLRSNYCRDPGPPYDNNPWCYTSDPKVRWEYCHVPKCTEWS